MVFLLCTALVFLFWYFIYCLIHPSESHYNFSKRHAIIVEEGLDLLSKTPFFISLDLGGKTKLINNAAKLLVNIKFVTEAGYSLDKSRSYKIALVLAMVALGLETEYHYDSLSRVVVYPDVFYSKRVQAEVRGLSTSSVLYISWNDFEYGFLHRDDRYNLGIHEAAHLLILCGHIRIGVTNDIWTALANEHIHNKNFNNVPNGLFRDYAFMNLDEFWACCVEQFYETPIAFIEQHPKLYTATKSKLGF